MPSCNSKQQLAALPRESAIAEVRRIGLYSMRFEDKSIASPDLPEPAEQAAVLLEIFEGDICEAKAVADTNVRFATTEQDILYWSPAGQTLVLGAGQLTIPESPSRLWIQRQNICTQGKEPWPALPL